MNSTDTSTSLITINTAAQLPVKLTPLNYPSWRAQFNALLLGYDLLGYIDGTHPCPPKPATASPTLPHTFWVGQNQLLLHVILTFVSEPVISLISLMRRDAKPVSEYLQCIKAIVNELTLIDVPSSDDDLIIHILNGIGPEFKEVSTAIQCL